MSKKISSITITKEPIRLSQFLKLANVIQDGFEAKIRIGSNEVNVNGTLENRRGRKLYAGDLVSIDADTFLVILEE